MKNIDYQKEKLEKYITLILFILIIGVTIWGTLHETEPKKPAKEEPRKFFDPLVEKYSSIDLIWEAYMSSIAYHKLNTCLLRDSLQKDILVKTNKSQLNKTSIEALKYSNLCNLYTEIYDFFDSYYYQLSIERPKQIFQFEVLNTSKGVSKISGFPNYPLCNQYSQLISLYEKKVTQCTEISKIEYKSHQILNNALNHNLNN